VIPQVVHVAPLIPQALRDGASQVVPLQQPLAHDVASQTHCPWEQRWPWLASHAWPVSPHSQAPPAEQVSVSTGSHAPHAPPGGTPHVEDESAWHVWSAAQQPSGHEAALQTHAPFTQSWPSPH
jgi:hypothetical protein